MGCSPIAADDNLANLQKLPERVTPGCAQNPENVAFWLGVGLAGPDVLVLNLVHGGPMETVVGRLAALAATIAAKAPDEIGMEEC